MSVLQNMIKFIQAGDLWVYPILVAMVAGLAIALERWLFLRSVTKNNSVLWDNVFPLLSKGQFKGALDLVKNSDMPVARILTHGINRTMSARRHEDVELALEEGLMETMPRIEKRTNYISTIANVSTLLGLLGTIMGLIDAFAAVASADPAQKADLLSKSVSVAMNTTALGLISAIPLMLLYAYLQSKTNEVVESLEMVNVKFLNILRNVSQQQKSE